jgi:hypothetical protein
LGAESPSKKTGIAIIKVTVQLNLVEMHHIALNLIKHNHNGIKVKRKRTGWDNDYLPRLIRGYLSAIALMGAIMPDYFGSTT